MEMKELVDKYFEEIKIENAEFIPYDEAKSDAAYLLLNIPLKMLKDYMKLKGQNKKLPDGIEFWRETGLGKRLLNSDKYYGQGRELFLSDILDYLEDDIQVDYQDLLSSEKIRFAVIEIPELYDDEDF